MARASAQFAAHRARARAARATQQRRRHAVCRQTLGFAPASAARAGAGGRARAPAAEGDALHHRGSRVTRVGSGLKRTAQTQSPRGTLGRMPILLFRRPSFPSRLASCWTAEAPYATWAGPRRTARSRTQLIPTAVLLRLRASPLRNAAPWTTWRSTLSAAWRRRWGSRWSRRRRCRRRGARTTAWCAAGRLHAPPCGVCRPPDARAVRADGVPPLAARPVHEGQRVRLSAPVRGVAHARVSLLRKVWRVQGSRLAQAAPRGHSAHFRAPLQEPDCPFKHSSDDIKVRDKRCASASTLLVDACDRTATCTSLASASTARTGARAARRSWVLQCMLTRAAQPFPAPEAAWPGADAGASAHDGHATGPTRQRGAHARLGALVTHACGRIPRCNADHEERSDALAPSDSLQPCATFPDVSEKRSARARDATQRKITERSTHHARSATVLCGASHTLCARLRAGRCRLRRQLRPRSKQQRRALHTARTLHVVRRPRRAPAEPRAPCRCRRCSSRACLSPQWRAQLPSRRRDGSASSTTAASRCAAQAAASVALRGAHADRVACASRRPFADLQRGRDA